MIAAVIAATAADCGIFARAARTAVEGVVPPVGRSGPQNRSSALWPWFKPERIQFWLKLIARFVLAVIEGVSEETGKSGAASEEVDW